MTQLSFASLANRLRIIKKITFVTVLCASLWTAHSAERVSVATRSKLSRELPLFNLTVGNDVLIRTFKEESQLELWMKPANSAQYTLFKTYPICYYSGRLGPKMQTGDEVTPEGFYRIEPSALNPNSRFHLSMDVGYPNAFDLYHGRTGSLLMIHGACDAVGCFAMGDSQIEEIYYLVESALQRGQPSVPVHAFPFHLTDSNMKRHQASHWYSFWQQLKVGYDTFNQRKVPPLIRVENGYYTVSP